MAIRTRLSIMMFLEFFVWGAWYVSMTGFITESKMGGLTGAAYTVGPLAAIIAPFFLGMIADRFFASERVLAFLHVLGGVFLILSPFAARPFTLSDAPTDSSLFYKVFVHDLPAYSQPFTLCLFAHMLCYMPTLGLTASLAFHHLENQERDFPMVRVLGTIGWIVGNVAIGLLPGADRSPAQFYLAGGAAVLLGIYSLSLPHTPPPSKGKATSFGQILGIDSFRLFRNPSYTVFIICSFLICIPLAGYYQQGRNFVEYVDLKVLRDLTILGVRPFDSFTFTMSFGQMSEIVFMLLMPLFFARLGVKWMLLVGMAAWVARYGLFAAAADNRILWMVFLGVLLHGICYDFFFVTGMIYVDKRATQDIRHQAQGFLVLVTQGLGLGLGSKLFFAHVLMNSPGGVADWRTIWLYPCLFAAGVMVVFFLFFWDRVASEQQISTERATRLPEEAPR
jgi:nucleoside transporter